MNENRVFATLREHGYTTVAIDAGYAHEQIRRVDRYVEQPQPIELENILIGETRLYALIEAVAPGTHGPGGARSGHGRIRGGLAHR